MSSPLPLVEQLIPEGWGLMEGEGNAVHHVPFHMYGEGVGVGAHAHSLSSTQAE